MKNPFRHLLGNPITRAAEALKAAAMVHAQAVSSVKYHQMMLEFYNQQALTANPHEHWWEFAAAKDSAKHHTEELQTESRLEAQAKARLDACRERLRMLRLGDSDG